MASSPPLPQGTPKSAERELLERAVHDLKNPLAVVRASLEWLEVEVADREEALDAIRDASAASDRLVAIVDDLDSLARLGTDGIVAGDRVPIPSLVGAALLMATPRLARRGISVASTGDTLLETAGDGHLLRRSLEALIDAAARGAPVGACVELAITRVSSPSGDPTVEIGVGLRGAIDAGASESSLAALESSGLGVYVALRILEAHGGSLLIVPTTSLPRMVVRLPC